MNLFEEYKTLRKKHGLTASQAHLWCKGKATHAWRVALREWEFNANMIRNNMTERERMLWRHDIGHGREVQVFGGYDQDFDPLDGYCTTSYRHTEERWTNQDTISHEDGTYWVWANSDWVMVQFSDGLDTKYFRARGYAKQPAFEKAVESRKSQLKYVTDTLQGYTTIGYFNVKIVAKVGGDEDVYEDDEHEGGAVLAEADCCGGVEVDDDHYLLEFLNEQYEEAVRRLTA